MSEQQRCARTVKNGCLQLAIHSVYQHHQGAIGDGIGACVEGSCRGPLPASRGQLIITAACLASLILPVAQMRMRDIHSADRRRGQRCGCRCIYKRTTGRCALAIAHLCVVS